MNNWTEKSGIAREVRRVLIDALGLELREEELSYSDNLHDLVAMDSVAVVGFIVALEKKFGMRFEPEWLDLERLTDLPSLADYICRRATMPDPDGGRPAQA